MINISCIEYKVIKKRRLFSKKSTFLKYGIPFYNSKGDINLVSLQNEIEHWKFYKYKMYDCEITFFNKRSANILDNRSFGQQKYFASIEYLKNIFSLY